MTIEGTDRKAVLVTGCSSGIGRELALSLARRGYVVFATVRTKPAAAGLRALEIPGLIPISPVDLTDPAQIADSVRTVAYELRSRGIGGLYALVNNAGGGTPAPIELMDLEMFQREFTTRLRGSVAMVQACLPLIRRGRGRILWIMTPALIPTPYVASIHACDFAVDCIARTLEIELKAWAIPVVRIKCGGIRTPAGLRTTSDVEAVLQHGDPERVPLYAQALRRWGTEMAAFDRKRTPAEQVADTVLRALAARQPKRRYSVGYMSAAARVLEALPASLADSMLKMRF